MVSLKSLVVWRQGMPVNFYDTMQLIKYTSNVVFWVKETSTHDQGAVLFKTCPRLLTAFPANNQQKIQNVVIFQYFWK